MLTNDQLVSLDEAWTPARAAGVIGTASVETLVEHTVWFAQAVCSSFSAAFDDFHGCVVDVGTGAGLPGVILAALLPHAKFRLVDASERRLDHARRASRALGVADRVEIVHGRGDELAHDVSWRGTHDVAVARLLGDPAETIEQLAPLVRPGGVIVTAAAESATDRWDALPITELPTSAVSWSDSPVGRFASVNVLAPVPPSFPRRERNRRQSPLF
jgi:16S rRNA G527 N7-methylase RsmG